MITIGTEGVGRKGFRDEWLEASDGASVGRVYGFSSRLGGVGV